MKYIFAIAFMLSLIGCFNPEDEKRDYQSYEQRWAIQAIPPGSKEVQYIGDGWLYFSFEGRKFLFRHKAGYAGNSALTVIP